MKREMQRDIRRDCEMKKNEERDAASDDERS